MGGEETEHERNLNRETLHALRRLNDTLGGLHDLQQSFSEQLLGAREEIVAAVRAGNEDARKLAESRFEALARATRDETSRLLVQVAAVDTKIGIVENVSGAFRKIDSEDVEERGDSALVLVSKLANKVPPKLRTAIWHALVGACGWFAHHLNTLIHR